MPLEEKRRFQQELDKYMRDNNRKAFHGPVVIQLDFFPRRGNPPSIHKLAKNYIDLLYPTVTRALRLPMKDDRQISMLIVNYHVQEENEEPLIRLTIAPMRDFMEDLRLYENIRSGSGFPEDDGYMLYDADDLIENVERDDPNALDRALESLEEYRELKKDLNILRDLSLETHYIRSAQSAFLRGLDIKPSHIPLMYDTREDIGKHSTIFNDFRDQYRRDLIISVPFTPLKSTGLPTKEGETVQFKKLIRSMLDQYKERYSILRPLLVNLKVTILYIPAINHESDLDNLARKIIPMVNEILKPPAGLWFNVNSQPAGFPKQSIIQYQVIKLPRSINDPEDGVARVVLGEYEPFHNLWAKIDKLIDAWADRID